MSDYEKEQAALKALFEQVQNKTHWKDKINAVIPIDSDVNGIHKAVIHFTGSAPTITNTKVKGKPMLRVKAAGYWATIGS